MRYVPTVAVLASLVLFTWARGADRTPEQRLADQLQRAAAITIRVDPITVDAIAIAMALVEEALKLDPGDPERWRMAANLARFAERDDAYEEAVRRIVQLDPGDEAARLKRLALTIAQLNSAEERVERYERLVAPEHREDLGSAVSSRLLLDQALLHRRQGDIDAFSRALADATVIDPSNRTAAAIAAGFFRMNVDDAYGEAELLMNLVLADPTDVTAQVSLAQLLLEQGAYRGGRRFYQMATKNMRALGIAPPSDLLADQAVAQWGDGDAEAALLTITVQQRRINALYRARIRQEQSIVDPLELARHQALLRPTLATVQAAIDTQRDGPDRALSLDAALRSYQGEIERLEGLDPPVPDEVARVRLEMAWMAVWLGDDTARVESLLEAADAVRPLSESARARFDGWLALRGGDLETAAAKLEPVASNDPAASLGLGHLYLRQDRRGDAARAFLATARARPGSVIGIWAANEVMRLVGRRVALSDEVRQLEELISNIPPFFDRIPDSLAGAAALHAEALDPTVGPYEPIVLRIRVVNNSQYPLAIDPDGPIRPQVMLRFTTTLAGRVQKEDLAPAAIDIDRKLRLEPHESVTILVDLRRYHLGELLNLNPLSGAFVRVKAMLNFRAKPKGGLEPALMGSEKWTETIRVDGVRTTMEWLTAAIAAIREPAGREDLVSMALVSHLLASRFQVDIADEQKQRLQDALAALVEAFDRLDPVSQAWLVGVMPKGRIPEGIREAALASDSHLVQLTYLMFQVGSPEDPMLERTRDSPHEHIRLLTKRGLSIGDDRTARPPARPGGGPSP